MIDGGIEAGMISLDAVAFTPGLARTYFVAMSRGIARMTIEEGGGPGTTHEQYGQDDDGSEVLLCTVEIEEGGRVLVTYPNDLVFEFEPGDLFDPKDN
jgi:hypothetical protein